MRAKIALLLIVSVLGSIPVASAFSLDGASDYAVLFEGGGANTLQVTNVTVNGNFGVGNTGKMTVSGPATLGRIDFSAANNGQFSSNNGANVFAGPFYNVAAVTSALNYVNNLNVSLGSEAGTNVNINGSSSINAASGTFDASGNSVFNVTGFNTTNGDTLTINGDGVHSVVLNFSGLSVNFNNQVVLNNISPDQVLYNFVGGANLSGGPTLQINDNGNNNPHNLVQGVFLDPNGPVSVTNSNLLGRVFGGDSHDVQVVSGDTINVPVPEPTSCALLIGGGLFVLGFGLFRRVKPDSR